MKKAVLVAGIFAVVVLSIILVSAFNFNGFFGKINGKSFTGRVIDSGSCLPDQTIFKISDITNAHGELWNGVNYNKAICYTEFWVTYSGASPHLCTSTNTVLKLSGDTNAHGEINTLNNYNYNVCYGDLSCTNRAVCNSDEKNIINLSSNTNAHFGADASYPTLVCCKQAPIVPAGCPSGICRVYWSDRSDGSAIIRNTNVNIPVWLVALTGPEITNVNFSIYEEDGFTDDKVRVGANALQIPASNGKAIARWDITNEDMRAGGECIPFTNVCLEPNPWEFYFSANYTSLNNVSDLLFVDKIPSGNVPPIAQIISPNDGDINFTAEEVFFNHNSYDPDGGIVGASWNVSDGNLITQDSFTHAYFQGGTKEITLTITDNEGDSATDRVTITIIREGVNVVPIISAPIDGQMYTDLEISYDGSNSYVFNDTRNSLVHTLICFGGNCPDMIRNIPILDTLNKKGVFDEMFYNWTFGVGIPNVQGYARKNGKVNYTLPGDQQIALLVKAFGEEGTDKVSFRIGGSQFAQCSNDRTKYFDGNRWLNTTGTSAATCDALPTDEYPAGCCPVYYTCDFTSHYCTNQCNTLTLNNSQIRNCGDYNNVPGNKQAQCVADCNFAKENDKIIVESNLPSNQHIFDNQYGCVWDETGSSCGFWYNFTTDNSDGSRTWITRFSNYTETGCLEGLNTMNWCDYEFVNTLTGGIVRTTGGCIDPRVISADCEEGTITLPFFGMLQLIASAISIIIVYAIYINFKKRKNGE